jgi:predicted glycosyltransferase
MEASRAPGSVPNEQYVTIETNIKLKMRVQCMGPYFEDKTLPLTKDIILLEVGGGSAGADLIGLQLKFK